MNVNVSAYNIHGKVSRMLNQCYNKTNPAQKPQMSRHAVRIQVNVLKARFKLCWPCAGRTQTAM